MKTKKELMEAVEELNTLKKELADLKTHHNHVDCDLKQTSKILHARNEIIMVLRDIIEQYMRYKPPIPRRGDVRRGGYC